MCSFFSSLCLFLYLFLQVSIVAAVTVCDFVIWFFFGLFVKNRDISKFRQVWRIKVDAILLFIVFFVFFHTCDVRKVRQFVVFLPQLDELLLLLMISAEWNNKKKVAICIIHTQLNCLCLYLTPSFPVQLMPFALIVAVAVAIKSVSSIYFNCKAQLFCYFP